MRTHISLRKHSSKSLPPEFQNDDVRFSERLVEHFLNEYTQPHATVLDPFAGFGTTLLVAERMDRVGYGVELDPRRVAYAKSQLAHPERLLEADSYRLGELNLPRFDLSLSSPPYMSSSDPEDPLSAYQRPGAGYPAYLRGLTTIYEQLKDLMQPAAHVVVEVSNIRSTGNVTTLAWDLAAQLSTVFHFLGETVVAWDHYGYGYDHSYCLVYQHPARRKEGS